MISRIRLCDNFRQFSGYLVNKLQEISFFLAVMTLGLPSIAKADYAARIQDPNSGYLIKLDSDSLIEPFARPGTDGRRYYRVGSPLVIEGGSSEVSVSGLVDCIGRTWGSSKGQIVSENAFHRLFVYTPTAGVEIDGKPAYQINSNLMMTIETRIMDWTNINAGVCSYTFPGVTYPASQFMSQFPITITFYINERIIDGQLIIAPMDLAGYVRAYTWDKTVPPYDSWPLNESTVPMRLAASQLNVGALCSTTTSTGQSGSVNLRHGQLNSINYDSTVQETVSYTCQFASSTKVRLRLDYTKDSDPQKRLPLHSDSDDVIYSQLLLHDGMTGVSGTDIKLTIEQIRDIHIISRIQGENAKAGNYQGSAWLIATFD